MLLLLCIDRIFHQQKYFTDYNNILYFIEESGEWPKEFIQVTMKRLLHNQPHRKYSKDSSTNT